ncbi:MAG TPA: ABC transporter permease, partial [Thermomicrobiales bacterium]|nr:ABC transporter permease [Thermomicrobiales bacterium]
MGPYLLRRVIAIIPVVFGVTIAVFAMMHVVPGDPAEIMLGDFQTSPEQLAQLRSQLHLGDPLVEQYGRFVIDAAQGNLGTSIRTKRPVSDMIWENLPSTIELTLAGLCIAMAIGVTLGIAAAIRQNTWVDVGSMVFAGLGVSMPSFWLGIMLVFLFSLHLRWLPAAGGGDLKHLVMPALALGLGASAILARLVRSTMIEVLNQDYIVTARAKGLRPRSIIVRHALRNALTPVV